MILHIDGDAFFASCEVALNPTLKGKPVITGLEKGIASSMSYEAKRRGVTRAMPLFQIRKVCPDAVIVPSHFDTYMAFSRRMFFIVRRYADVVEEYSIDECFADLSHYGDDRGKLLEIGRRIKEEVALALGITVSLGIAPSKVLAKVASKWQKPDGLFYIAHEDIERVLNTIPAAKVWGIGASTSVKLSKLGVCTAGEFITKSESWVREHLARPYLEIWHELKGTSTNPVHEGAVAKHASISKTRMFKPPRTEKEFVFAELAKNIENACRKARACRRAPKALSFYIKTQDFRYLSGQIKFPRPTNIPHEMITAVRPVFDKIFVRGERYRATGVNLWDMAGEEWQQTDIFGGQAHSLKMRTLYEQIDRVEARFGKHVISLASSLPALHQEATESKTLYLPSMGEAH